MKYLKIPNGFLEDIGLLSDAEVGRLFSAMLHFAETGEETRLKYSREE